MSDMSEDLDLVLRQLEDQTRRIRTINLTSLSDLRRDQAMAVHAAMKGFSPHRRLELVSAMVEQAEANVHLNFLAILRECMTDAEASVRKAAIDGLWEDERPALVTPLVRFLNEDPAAEVRAAAAISLGRFVLLGVLGEIGDSYAGCAEQALRAAWARPGEGTEVRRRALEGLAYTDEAGVDEIIEVAYYDEDDLMRQSAIFAMGRSADRRWARLVLTELGSLDAAMRYEAAGAAGELALTSAVKPLVRLLDAADTTVRETAALALGKIGGKDARQALETCLQSSDNRLVEAASEALEELAFNSEGLDMPLMEYGESRSDAEDESFDDEYGLEEDDFDDLDEDDLEGGFGFEDDDDLDEEEEDEDNDLDADSWEEIGWGRRR
jgi:hypothetical protein